MFINNNLHELQQIKHPQTCQKLLKRTGHHRGLISLFGVCKIVLVSHIEYDRNIQTLIYKSDFSMWQQDLEIHDGITT